MTEDLPHEISNQLTVILGNTNIILTKFKDASTDKDLELVKRIHSIERAANKIAELIE